MRKIGIILAFFLAAFGGRAQFNQTDTDVLYAYNWIIYQGDTLGVASVNGDTLFLTKGADVDTLIVPAGASYWQLRGSSTDTITAAYNVYLDSAFIMEYDSCYFGYSSYPNYVEDGMVNGLVMRETNGDTTAIISVGEHDESRNHAAYIYAGGKNGEELVSPKAFINVRYDTYPYEGAWIHSVAYGNSGGTETVLDSGKYEVTADTARISSENVYMPDITSDGGKFEYLVGLDPNGRLFPQPLASGYDSIQKAIAAAPTAYSTWVRDTTAQRLSPANTTDTVYIPAVLKLGSDLYAPEIGFQLVPSTEMNVLVKNDATGLIHTYPLSQFQTTMDTSGTGLWQLDSANNEVYLNDLDWKVGIGTSTPSEALEISGGAIKLGKTVENTGYNKLKVFLYNGTSPIISTTTHTWSGSAWTTNEYNTHIGPNAGRYNRGSGLFVGRSAGEYNEEIVCTGIGDYALHNNSANYVSGFGYEAGSYNTGEDAQIFGFWAGSYNTGAFITALGYAALKNNNGFDCIGIGYQALYRNNSDNAIRIGRQTNASNMAGLEDTIHISRTDFDTITDRIYIPAHGWGDPDHWGSYISLKTNANSEGAEMPAGWTENTFTLFQVVDEDSLYYDFSEGGYGSGNFILTNYKCGNTITIGNDVFPTAENQVVIGDTNITETVLRGEVKTNGGYSYEDPTPYMRSFRAAPIYSNDFFINSTPLPWSGAAITSGTFTVPATPEENHPGVCMIKSSASANSGYRLITGTTSMLPQPGGRMEAIFKVVNTANTIATFGFFDATDGDSASVTEGYYIWLNGTTLRGNVVNLTDPGEAITATSYTITQDVWYTMAVELNATKDTATFELYSEAGALLWTDTVSNYVSNIGWVHSGFAAQRTTTTATELIYLDYMALSFKGLQR